ANVNAVKRQILINYGPYSQELESRYHSMKVVACAFEAELDFAHSVTELPQVAARRYQYWASHNLQLIRTQEGTLGELQATLVAKKEKLQLKAQREDRQAQNFQN
ncbi:hypothetical protein EI555_009681, partial [Monodon monoceros]